MDFHNKLEFLSLANFHNKLEVFVPGKPFQPSLVFAGKAAEPTQVKHLSGFPLSSNTRRGWRGLPETNTLAIMEIHKLWP
jgi:hypothetical protein